MVKEFSLYIIFKVMTGSILGVTIQEISALACHVFGLDTIDSLNDLSDRFEELKQYLIHHQPELAKAIDDGFTYQDICRRYGDKITIAPMTNDQPELAPNTEQEYQLAFILKVARGTLIGLEYLDLLKLGCYVLGVTNLPGDIFNERFNEVREYLLNYPINGTTIREYVDLIDIYDCTAEDFASQYGEKITIKSMPSVGDGPSGNMLRRG